jgi:hypothetical protein
MLKRQDVAGWTDCCTDRADGGVTEMSIKNVVALGLAGLLAEVLRSA